MFYLMVLLKFMDPHRGQTSVTLGPPEKPMTPSACPLRWGQTIQINLEVKSSPLAQRVFCLKAQRSFVFRSSKSEEMSLLSFYSKSIFIDLGKFPFAIIVLGSRFSIAIDKFG